MTTIASVRGVLPVHSYPQREITDAFADWCVESEHDRALLHRFHRNAEVDRRHTVLPLEEYRAKEDFRSRNDAFIEHGTALGAEAVTAALAAAGVAADEVDLIVFTTVTGVAVPSLDALIVPLVGLRPDVKRMPLFGLGCVAGAAGLARVHDYLCGHPDDVALLVSVELCTLTVQRGDTSVANLVASGLFGDGAAAVVLLGDERARLTSGVSGSRGSANGPQIIDSRSHLYPDSRDTMGWSVGGTGLKIVLNAEVPSLVERYLADDVEGLLKEHGLCVGDIDAWVCHPGGPKVIDAIESTLALPAGELDVTRRSLRRVGNLSSSSVLHVFADVLTERDHPPGSTGVLMAMGPGFCSELVLLRW